MRESISGLGIRSLSLVLVALGLAACATPEQTASAPPVQPAKLGYTCADNAINCAYKTRDHRPVAGATASIGGVREVRRTQGPVPPLDEPHALAQVQVGKLRPVDQRWILDATISAAAIRAIDPEIVCDFTNAGQVVASAPYTASSMSAGEIVEVQMTGPAVTATYVDGATCKVIRPLHY